MYLSLSRDAVSLEKGNVSLKTSSQRTDKIYKRETREQEEKKKKKEKISKKQKSSSELSRKRSKISQRYNRKGRQMEYIDR
jgi:hypothetical protein